jgi:hypothetical protein
VTASATERQRGEQSKQSSNESKHCIGKATFSLKKYQKFYLIFLRLCAHNPREKERCSNKNKRYYNAQNHKNQIEVPEWNEAFPIQLHVVTRSALFKGTRLRSRITY